MGEQPPAVPPSDAGAPPDPPGTAPLPVHRAVPPLPAWARSAAPQPIPPQPNPVPPQPNLPQPNPVAPQATAPLPTGSYPMGPQPGSLPPQAMGPVPVGPPAGYPMTGAFRPAVPPWQQTGPPRPAKPAFRIRRWHVLLVAAVLLVGMGSVGAVAWQSWRTAQASAPVIGGAAADALAALPAVRMRYTYVTGDGRAIDGTLVVTAQRYASGTVTDAGSGTAALRATPTGTAVYGDRDWWGRRAPEQVSRVADRWVRPASGVAFPVDADTLTPARLASVVRTIGTHGRVSERVASLRGRRVVTVAYGGWTMAVTADEPRRLVSLGVPVDASGIRPAAWSGDGTRVVPAGIRTGPADTRAVPAGAVPDGGRTVPVGDTGDGGYFTVDPSDGNSRDADATRSSADRTMRGQGAAPSGVPGTPSAAPSAAPGGQPPAQSDLPAARPDFRPRINAGDCSTPSCPLSVTVENNGDAPGDAVVTASVTPGMAPRSVDLGEIPAGGSRTTPTMRYPNQAPTPEPGQTTSTTVSAEADVYSPQLDGDDRGRYDYLRRKGIDPDKDQTLSGIDPALKNGVVDALYGMLQSGVDATDAQNAVRAADEGGLLPDVGALAGAGDRVTGWDVLARALAQGSSDPSALADKRRGIERAREYLDRDPDCRVGLSPLTGKTGGDAGLKVTGTCPAATYPAPSGDPISRADCLGQPLNADSWALYRNPNALRGDRASGAAGCFGSTAGKAVTADPSDPPGRRPGMDRGHLIGRQFGGISGADNMVPLYPDTNQIVMKKIEGEVAKLAKTQRVYYTVTPIYGDLANPLIPSAVELSFETAAGQLETAIILNRP
ncbi:MAG TPA: DNA/RNA non-specific endonuclease [Actinocatenispora sp.]